MGLRDRMEQATDANGVATRDIAAGETVTVQLPALGDSDIEVDPEASVFGAWRRVMGEVEYVGKGTSKGLTYEFRGIDAVLNAVGPALRKHGVVVLPVRVVPDYERVQSKNGASLVFCRAVVDFLVIGPKGDTMPVAQVLGEAFDTGDKAATKAQSVALRTFLINALAIPTNQPERDTEYGTQHELAAPARPAPAEIAAEILDDRTTLPRLRQIKALLTSDRETGSAMAEDLNGSPVRLIDLVQRVGIERTKKTED